jgi:hypothetical protein
MRIRTVSFLFLVYWSVGLVQGQGKGKGKGNGGNDGDKGDNDNNVPVCPPVDQDGTLLEEPSSGDGFLTCSYPAAGSCTYVVCHDV